VSLIIARIPQVDGSIRIVRAQDEYHAAKARTLVADNPTWIDYLHGVDGIQLSVTDTAPIPRPRNGGSR
jgi:hypothetical protein